MTATEFFLAIRAGAKYSYEDISRLIENKFERFNAEMMYADFMGALYLDSGRDKSTIDDYDPNQPRYPKGHPKGGQWRSKSEGGSYRDVTGKYLSAEKSLEYDRLKKEFEKAEAKGMDTPEDNRNWWKAYHDLENFKAANQLPDYRTALAGAEPWRELTMATTKEVMQSFTDKEHLAAEYAAVVEQSVEKINSGEWDVYHQRAVDLYHATLTVRAFELDGVHFHEMSSAEMQAYLDGIKERGKADGSKMVSLWASMAEETEKVLVRKLVEDEKKRKLAEQKEFYEKETDARIALIGQLGLEDKAPYVNYSVLEYSEAQGQKYQWDDPSQPQEFVRGIKGADIAIAFDSNALEGIYDLDGFHNQHEIQNSNGYFGPDERSQFENSMWDLGGASSPEEHPVYGFVTGANGSTIDFQADTASQYGRVYAFLKPEMDQYTTITVGDSLNHNQWWQDGSPPELAAGYWGLQHVRVPTPKLNPDPNVAVMVHANMPTSHRKVPTPWTNQGYSPGFEYIEAQIHKRPSIDTIREFRVDADAGNHIVQEVGLRAASILRKFKRNHNIPVMIPAPNGGWIEVDFDDLPPNVKADLDKLG